jgi:hypothetical protein
MANRLVVLGAAVAALLAVSGFFDAADARHGGGAGGHHGGRPSVGARSFSAPAARPFNRPAMQAFKGQRSVHHGHRRHFTDAGYAYYDSCSWLRQNALRAGNRYWWSRYYACLDGYGPY